MVWLTGFRHHSSYTAMTQTINIDKAKKQQRHRLVVSVDEGINRSASTTSRGENKINLKGPVIARPAWK